MITGTALLLCSKISMSPMDGESRMEMFCLVREELGVIRKEMSLLNLVARPIDTVDDEPGRMVSDEIAVASKP